MINPLKKIGRQGRRVILPPEGLRWREAYASNARYARGKALTSARFFRNCTVAIQPIRMSRGMSARLTGISGVKQRRKASTDPDWIENFAFGNGVVTILRLKEGLYREATTVGGGFALLERCRGMQKPRTR